MQVIDSSEPLAQSRQGEQSKEEDLAEEIEQMLEQMDTEMVWPKSD